jgi:hypothetical protein
VSSDSGLAKAFHKHHVGLVEFVLTEEQRFTIRRKGQPPKECAGLLEVKDGRRLSSGEVEILYPAARWHIPVHNIDSTGSQSPQAPRDATGFVGRASPPLAGIRQRL